MRVGAFAEVEANLAERAKAERRDCGSRETSQQGVARTDGMPELMCAPVGWQSEEQRTWRTATGGEKGKVEKRANSTLAT